MINLSKNRKSCLRRSFGDRGFTLIEVIIYIAVLAIIVSAVYSLFLWTVKIYSKSRAIRETTESARRALETITYEINSADGIYSPTSSTTQLSLATRNQLSALEDLGYVDFFLCSGQLCIKRDGRDPEAITSENVTIQSLSFSQVFATSSIPSVRVSFEASFNNPGGKPEYRSDVQTVFSASLRRK